MHSMFCNSEFNKNISNWKIKNNCITLNMFLKCDIIERYKPKGIE
jgi:hypothetical protein